MVEGNGLVDVSNVSKDEVTGTIKVRVLSVVRSSELGEASCSDRKAVVVVDVEGEVAEVEVIDNTSTEEAG